MPKTLFPKMSIERRIREDRVDAFIAEARQQLGAIALEQRAEVGDEDGKEIAVPPERGEVESPFGRNQAAVGHRTVLKARANFCTSVYPDAAFGRNQEGIRDSRFWNIQDSGIVSILNVE